ncbi:cytochrome P450 [Amycolatopsis sp. OK19-0408]|uniref:Cytochrome P450 n=1 Tax=Amycolatopsis iheyensis TaxID=2945988 RepID=A0A9X2NBQ4_9PSEU|nr:cytochrome P450 [Amycolatopsis iheyensis]MCR6484127.1 cytochrome P450 [Amycolatopsis iheyensis]
MTSLTAPVPPVPSDVPPGSVAWLRATVARFSNGDDHTRRRALAVSLLDDVDPDVLRRKASGAAGGDSRLVVVGVLAGELGLPVVPSDVVTVAAAYHPHVTPSAEAEAALGRLVAACGGTTDELAAARIGLLIQACEATAGLIGAADPLVRAGKSPEEAVAEVLRTDPPVAHTRRRVRGEDVLVPLAGTPFGAGPRECPGPAHAIALAAGVLRVTRDRRENGLC